MKTPKELLLTKHTRMQSRLDAMRHAVVADLEPAPTWNLREFLLSLRWHFGGLSAVWLAVLVLSTNGGSTAQIAKVTPQERQEWAAAIVANRAVYLELVALPMAQPIELPPRRSERPISMEIV